VPADDNVHQDWEKPLGRGQRETAHKTDSR
jgi:hypothetical protein